MCYNHEEEWRREYDNHTPPQSAAAAVVRSVALLEDLTARAAETEFRLQQARAREAALTRQLHETKRFVLVMEIIESYLQRRFLQQQQLLARLLSPVPPPE